MKFVIGDLVTRKSYKHDVLFRIANISQKKAILHGEYIRLKADAPIRDIEKTEVRELKRWQKKSKSKEEFSYRLFKQDYQLLEEKREFRSEEHTSELQSRGHLVCRLLLEKK